MIELKIFVTEDCWTCLESRKIAVDVAEQFPHLHVEVVELGEGVERPTAVFAVPTYTLNGEVIALGNPLRNDLYHKLVGAGLKETADMSLVVSKDSPV